MLKIYKHIKPAGKIEGVFVNEVKERLKNSTFRGPVMFTMMSGKYTTNYDYIGHILEIGGTKLAILYNIQVTNKPKRVVLTYYKINMDIIMALGLRVEQKNRHFTIKENK